MPHTRILGGENASVKTFQFFLASSSANRHDFGAAVLISDRHAITSGKMIAGYDKPFLCFIFVLIKKIIGSLQLSEVGFGIWQYKIRTTIENA